MNPTKNKVLIISILFTGLLWFSRMFIITEVFDFIFEKFHLFFITGINAVDMIIIGFIPFWIYLAYKWKPSLNRSIIITTTTFFSLICCIFIASLLAIKYGKGPSPLLPDYLVYEIFPFYWTTVIAVAIAFGILPFKPWRKTHNSLLTRNTTADELVDR